MTGVNINRPRDLHRRHCEGRIEPWAEYGSVRRCEHGLIMLGVESHGTIPAVWRTLHPLLDPIRHWRARTALSDAALDWLP